MARLFFFITIFSLSLMIVSGAHALTVDEIIELKKAGVSDETIQMLIKHPSPDPYNNMGTWEVKTSDGKEATIYTTGTGKDRGEEDQERVEEENREKAWEMLNNMVIDGRSGE